MRRLLKSIATFLLGVLFTIFVAGVGGEFLIEVARDKGWYTDAGKRWDSIMSALSDFVVTPYFLYPSLLLAGLVVGLWVDSLFRRNEESSPSNPHMVPAHVAVDKQVLIEDLDKFADALAAFAAESEAKATAAREQDDAEWEKDREAIRGFPPRKQFHEANRRMKERYQEKFHPQFRRLYERARRLVSVNSDAMWRTHDPLHGSDISDVVATVITWASQLRHGDETKAEFSRNQLLGTIDDMKKRLREQDVTIQALNEKIRLLEGIEEKKQQ